MTLPGRNDLCPCGSGKKYKRCCMSTEIATAMEAPAAEAFEEAIALHQNGMIDRAEELYAAILQKDADYAPAMHYLGLIAYQKKNYQEAIRLMERAIELEPGTAKYYSNLSLPYEELMELDRAAHYLFEAVRLKPEFADACLNLSSVLYKLVRIDEAYSYALKTVELIPDSARAQDNLGVILTEKNDFPGAIQRHQRALELDPTYARAYTNMASAYLKLKNLTGAAACCVSAMALDNKDAKTYLYLGVVCQEQGNLEQALTFMIRASELAPLEYLIHWNICLLMLGMGKLEAGWKSYECRWQLEHILPLRKLDLTYPWWQGEAMPDKTIFIWPEQGIGDQIMFAGMIVDLIPRFKKCIIACPEKLFALYTRSFPGALVMKNTDVAQFSRLKNEIDVQSPIGSLARWLRPTVASFPRNKRFLVPDPERVSYWKNRLAGLGPGPKVGICWRSGNVAGDRKFYCSTIEQWQPIFAVAGIHFINLQYDECSAELTTARQEYGTEVHAFSEVDLYDDLDETAALTSALDLVIAAPTSAPILAASLGVPSWFFISGFTWQTFGTGEICWYSTARHMGRSWDQPWEAFLANVALELKAWIDRQAGA